MAEVWGRIAHGVRSRVREGWLTPFATLAGVLVVVVATLILAAPLSALKAWEIPAARTAWIVDTDLAGMRRLRADETPRPLRDLPRVMTVPGVQVFHLMDRQPAPVDDLALLAPAVSGSEVRAYINGIGLPWRAVKTDRAVAAPWSTAMLWTAPASHLRPGANRIDVLIAGSSGPALSAPLYLGPRARLAPILDRQAAAASTGRRLAPPAALVVVLTSLLGALLDGKARPTLLAGAAMVSALGARAALGEQAAVVVLGPVWAPTDRLMLSLALLALGLLLTGGKAPRWPRAVYWTIAGVMGLALGIDFAGPSLAPSLASPAAWSVILVSLGLPAAGAASTGGLRWDRPPVRRARTVSTAAVLMLTATLTAWTGLGLYAGLSGPMLDIAYLVALALMMTGMLAVAVSSTVSGGALLIRTRLDLSGIVRQQKVQIEAAAAALEQEMRRAAILEERQRLARDMHDGVGGQLVSLIARVRSRRITIDQVEGELVQGLSELRLVVDSLDAPSQSLADAMLAFRLRTQNLAEGAGMALTWSQSNLEGAETGDSRWVLTLYRFMQEAVTNAVRHSGGHKLDLRAERTGRRIVVEIADDGRGFNPAAVSGGKGLRNLAFRAGQLGGAVTVTSEPGGGTSIRLEAPLPLD